MGSTPEKAKETVKAPTDMVGRVAYYIGFNFFLIFGIVLLMIAAGFLWNELRLSRGWLKAGYWFLLYGTFANWSFTLFAAILGTSIITPIAGAGHTGTDIQEAVLTAGFTSVGISMVLAASIMQYGLRPAKE